MVKIKLWADTGYTGCNHDDYEEVPDKEWNAMTEKEKEDYLNDMASIHLHNHIDYGACVVEEGEK